MTLILSATLRSELTNSRVATQMARSTAEVFAEQAGYGGNITEFAHAFELSVNEAFTNSVRHSGRKDEDREVSLSFEREQGLLRATITDSNGPFNPQPPAPEITGYPEGGYGLFIIRKLMDEVAYSRSGDRNTLTMTKRLNTY